MEYNTKRGDMMFREYGRSVKKIIDDVCELPDGDTKKEASQAIITMMGLVSGLSLRDDVSYHKLWDHLMLMSDFKLASAWPFEAKELETLKERNSGEKQEERERLPYKSGEIKIRQYGEYLQSMLKNLSEVPDGEEYNELVKLIAQHAKRDYLVWNGELSDDNIIVDQMVRMSGDERVEMLLRDRPIDVPNGTMPIDIISSKKKKKKKKNN